MAAQKHQISTNLQKKAFYTRGWDVPVPGQGRLALKCARRPFRPDLEGLVIAATDKQIAICAEADRIDTVLGISQ